ncbi:Crp/Fnr family transcriptional regulator [Pseudonocardia sp.]|uniref:Crp/Fnr family transcriptional regulator n=1 Tax=Pseudonocardia sp. TaxID=60912 RepID=UPI0031FD9F53
MKAPPPAGPANLGPGDWAELRALGHAVEHPQGAMVLLQGSPSDAMLVIESGLVAVSASDESGHEVFLAFRRAGDLLGEFGFLDRRPRSAMVRAVAPTRCRVFPGPVLDRFLAAHPDASRALTTAIVAKMRAVTDRRVRYSRGRIGDRVVRVLLDHAAQFGRPLGGGPARRIDVPLSQTRIADLVGAKPRIVGAELSRLQDLGLVDTGYRSTPRRLTVLDPGGLRLLPEADADGPPLGGPPDVAFMRHPAG